MYKVNPKTKNKMPALQEQLRPSEDTLGTHLASVEARADTMDLLHQQELVLDPANDIYRAEAIGLHTESAGGMRIGVIGEVGIPDSTPDGYAHAAILRVTNQTGEVRFALLGLQQVEGDRMQAMDPRSAILIDEKSSLILGRAADTGIAASSNEKPIRSTELWPGTVYSGDTSARHLALTARDGNIVLRDTSTNGTKVYTKAKDLAKENKPEYTAEHTQTAAELAAYHNQLNPYTKEFAGRAIIDRNTTDLEGKVDIRSWAAGTEAIVVDSTKDPESYNKLKNLFRTIADETYKAQGELGDRDFAHAVYETIRRTMDYDLEYANSFSNSLSGEARKVNLGAYIHDGKGVCRHMALAVAWLGGDVVKRGWMPGAFTAEVNQNNVENTAHEWARYTTPDGEVYIIDPAQKFFGTLGESLRHAQLSGQKMWEYFRPNERKEYEARKAVQRAHDGVSQDGLITGLPEHLRRK